MQIYAWSFLLSMPLRYDPQDNLNRNHYPRHHILTESLTWDFFFFKKFGNEKEACFTVYICVDLTTCYNSIYCVPFPSFALFVKFFYVYIFSFPPPSTPDFKFLQRRCGDWYEMILPPAPSWTLDTPIEKDLEFTLCWTSCVTGGGLEVPKPPLSLHAAVSLLCSHGL